MRPGQNPQTTDVFLNSRVSEYELEHLVESVENATTGYAAELDDLAGQAYVWEKGYDHSWTTVQAGADGSLQVAIQLKQRQCAITKKRLEDATKKESEVESGAVRRKPMLRNVCLVIDFSEKSKISDYKPSRIATVVQGATTLCQYLLYETTFLVLSIVIMRNAVTETLLTRSSDWDAIRSTLCSLIDGTHEASGHCSFANGLERALDILGSAGELSGGSKELIFFSSSIQSVDPRSPLKFVEPAHNMGVHVSCVSLVPEIFAIKEVCRLTGGQHHVALDGNYFHAVMLRLAQALPWSKAVSTALIQFGIAEYSASNGVQLCMCHHKAIVAKYSCPRCLAVHCSPPGRCVICRTHLVAEIDILRASMSYKTVPNRKELTTVEEGMKCSGCDLDLHANLLELAARNDIASHRALVCTQCQMFYCGDCDDLVAEALRHCPTCAGLEDLQRRREAVAA